MKIYPTILIILFCLFLISCGGSKYSVKNFSKLSDATYLDGTYENKFNKPADSRHRYHNDGDLVCIFKLPIDSIDSVNLQFNKKKMIVTFQTDSGLQSKSYKGKFKKNYFETHVTKKILPIPIFYFGWNIERVRIGLNEDKNLLIQYWQDSFGWILFGTGGSKDEKEYLYKKMGN